LSTAPTNIVEYRQKMEAEMQRVAGKMLVELVGADRAKEATARLGLAMRQAAMATPELYSAHPTAIANAIALSALTGLMPGGLYPDCYLVPRGGSGGGMVWMASHRGLIKLARRAGWDVDVGHVFKGERYRYVRTPFPVFEHEPNDDLEQTYDTLERGYLYYWPHGHRDDVRIFTLSREQIELHRTSSDFGNGNIWRKFWREMASKSLIKAAAGRGLLPLDDIGILAATSEDREPTVIDAAARAATTVPTVTAPPAEPPRQIPSDSLEADLLEPDEREKETLRTQKMEAAAGAAKGEASGKGSKPKGSKPPKAAKEDAPPKDAPPAQGAPDVVKGELVEAVKRGREALGPDLDKIAREKAGVGIWAADQLSVEQLRAYLKAQKVVHDEEVGGWGGGDQGGAS
jgi:recombinational DNA repair protein RecT